MRIWFVIVKRIRGYPEANDDTPVSAVSKKTVEFKVDSLSVAVKAIGEEKLGFKSTDIGTRSRHSGAAMFLDQIPIYTIMMILRPLVLQWRLSQVHFKTNGEFSHNVAKGMIKNLFYRHIPETES